MNHTVTSLNPDPRSFESLVFRMHQGMKFDGSDPLVADFILIHSPVKLLLLVAAIVTFLKAAEEWMKRRDEFAFARPAFLVNCGLTFGINGCGVMMAIAVTEGGQHLFQCVERSHLSLSTLFCRYIIFIYLATLVYDLFSLVLPILRKHKVSNHLIVRQLVWIGIAFVIIKHQPIGYPVFVPLTHSLLKVLNNMLTVMETASKELKPDSKWSQRLQYLSMLLHVVMVSHQMYFHSQSSCFPRWISSVIVTAAIVQTFSMFASLRRTESGKKFSNLILG